jgi:hypothetical protein
MTRPAYSVVLATCVLSVLLSACGVPVLDPGPPPEAEAPAPLSIRSAHADLVFSRADDEDTHAQGIQTTLRVDVSDELIERVDLVVSTQAGEQVLDDVVAEDLDGVRCARFVVTLAEAPKTPVRASTPDLSSEAIQEARATLVLAPE